MQIKSAIDHDLKKLDEWSKTWLMCFNPNKTEIMMFSNTKILNLKFSLNEKEIPIVPVHKHLGVTFTNDAKWNQHIENIIISVSKHINVLRKLKFRLCRKNLEKLYLVYVRPILEYASEVWDNCGVVNSNKLEHLQLEAARIITGLPAFTKSEIVYNEIGWEKLSERRQRRKLQMFYNMQNNCAPDYLCKLVPPTIQSTTIYPLRNGNNFIVPFCRLSLTSDSFIPSTIRCWNRLNPTIRRTESNSRFKNELKKIHQPKSIPDYYSFGPRKLNVILTQLRCSASFLNYDLNRVNIVPNPSCICGANIENAYHFVFECNCYSIIRTNLFNNLNWLPDALAINLSLLTRGSNDLTDEQNELIFKHVFEYIKHSRRFLVV